jgi:hypothetical protein
LKGFNDPFRAREKTFTVFFYGLKIFWCKIAQFSATRRECEMDKHLASATVCNIVKTCAKTHSSIRNPLLYPAELRAQIALQYVAAKERKSSGSLNG